MLHLADWWHRRSRHGGARVPRLDGRELAAIFAGGFAGAIARAGLAQALPHGTVSWPWATFAVNVGGAFQLGWLITRLQERLPLSAYRRSLLGTGFCGALTTFSTMQVELARMLEKGAVGLAVGYAAASIAAGIAAVWLAAALARRVRVLA
jgi:CrcB protein